MSHLTEIVIDEEREISYTVSATWGFLERLQRKHKSLNMVFASLTSGDLNPDYIKDTVTSSLTHINSEPVNDAQREKTAIEMIERFGLQEVSLLARDMISRAMIGDIKKSQLANQEEVQSLMSQLYPSLKSSRFYKAGSLWIMASVISGVVGSMIFNWLMMPT